MATVEEKELLRKRRTTGRRFLTFVTNVIKEKVSQNDTQGLKGLIITLDERARTLFTIDKDLQNVLCSMEMSEEDMLRDMDMENTSRIEIEYQILKENCEKLLQSVKPDDASYSDYTSASSAMMNRAVSTTKRNFQLPHLKVTRFDGNITNWLGFWGQFKKIDSDQTIDDDDKFQYLLRATEPGSSARELVESYPPSGTNYHKALEQLKARFAREEVLIQCYVRKLLDIVMFQGTNSGFTDLRVLYDKLNTQLRALESLGVTSNRYAAMLYPLVESAVPESTLRVWERTTKKADKELLEQLLEFLRLEVECEEKVQMAKTAFKEGSRPKEPTASCIVAIHKENQSKSMSSKASYNQNMSEMHRKMSQASNNQNMLEMTKATNNQSMSVMSTVKEDSLSAADGVFLCHKSSTTLLQTILVNLIYDDKVVKVR